MVNFQTIINFAKARIPKFDAFSKCFAGLVLRFRLMKTRFIYADDDSDTDTEELIRYISKRPKPTPRMRMNTAVSKIAISEDPNEEEVFENILKWMEKSRFSNPPTPENEDYDQQIFGPSSRKNSHFRSMPDLSKRQTYQNRILPLTPLYEASKLPAREKPNIRSNSTYEPTQRRVCQQLPRMSHRNSYAGQHQHGKKMVYLCDSENSHVYANYGSFEQYYHAANGHTEDEMTYPEVQRNCNNFLFSSERSQGYDPKSQQQQMRPKPRKYNNASRRFRRLVVQPPKPRKSSRKDSSSTGGSSTDKASIERKHFKSMKYHRRPYPKHMRSYSRPYKTFLYNGRPAYLTEEGLVFLPTREEQEKINKMEEEYSEEIAKRFSRYYWGVDDRLGNGAMAKNDNFHTRYFGNAGHNVVAMSINGDHLHRYSPAGAAGIGMRSSISPMERHEQTYAGCRREEEKMTYHAFDQSYELHMPGPSHRSAYKTHCQFYDDRVHNKVFPTVLPEDIRDCYWKTPKKYRHKFHHIY